MTTKINASTSGLTETVDTSGVLELQTANTTAVIIDTSQNANFASTGAITVPVGTTAQRPTGVNGMVRYNSNSAVFEFYANNTWTTANVTPPPVISVAPVISGTAIVGQNLTCTTGTWTGNVTGYYYQWLANSTAISNATANVFTLTSTQNNTNITCNVTAYNVAGNSTPSTSNTLGPVLSTYLINNSLRFRSSASAYMTRTPGAAGNRQKMTFSLWVKKAQLIADNTDQYLFSGGSFGASTQQTGIGFTTYSGSSISNSIRIESGTQGVSQDFDFSYPNAYRDPAAWYHIVVAFDTTQATASNRCLVYVNNQLLTGAIGYAGRSTTISQNYNLALNNNVAQWIGNLNSANYFDGYLAEVNFIDGQQLTPSSFGTTDTTSGAWVPIRYSGTYGTNGFYLPFSANTTSASYLLVAGGGGGGGGDISGGGGAGGLLANTVTISTLSSYSVTVGGGGNQGSSGSNSVISAVGLSTITAIGGGRGAQYETAAGATGGSGGGGAQGYLTGGNGTTGQGNNGGTGTIGGGASTGGGGGGAGQVGFNGANGGQPGNGGNGSTSSISGSVVTYAGGGAGGGRNSSTSATGGSGGGGNGGNSSNQNASAGSANTGGGGGGAAGSGGSSGGGGSGIGVISYASPQIFTGGTVTTSGSNKIHTFTSSSTLVPLVLDASGNSNNWTPNNISFASGYTYDSMLDVPTLNSANVSNFCVMNPLDSSTNLITNGNLTVTANSGAWYSTRGSFGMSSGKWYWEVYVNNGTTTMIGMGKSTATLTNHVGADANGYGYYVNGSLYYNNTGSAYGSSYTTGDTIGVTFDTTTGTLVFYKNNTSQGNAATGLTGTWFPMVGLVTSGQVSYNFGQQPFTYTPPSGFVALNAYNL